MFESCICVEPDEVCKLLSRHTRTARKPHECGECRGTIAPGDRYQVDSIIDEDEFSTHKICIPCLNVRDSLFECGWYYGSLWADIHEVFCGFGDDDEIECICPETAWARSESDERANG